MKTYFYIKSNDDLIETYSGIRGNFVYLLDGSKICINAELSDGSVTFFFILFIFFLYNK